MVNLDIFESGRYFADGSYGVNESSVEMPLQGHFSVEIMPNTVVIDGKWQQHSGRPTFAFRVEISRDHTSQSQASVRVVGSEVGELVGRFTLRGRTRELLALDAAKGHQLSARIVPTEKPRIYEISGLIAVNEHWFPFNLRLLPAEGERALSKVVALPKRA